MENTYRFANAVTQKHAFAMKDAESFEIPTDETPENPEDDSATSQEESTHDWKKRYSDLKTHLNKQSEATKTAEAELKKQVNELQEQIKSLNSTKAYPKTKEEVEAWVTNYPEFAQILETIIYMKSDEKLSEVYSKINEAEDQLKSYQALQGRVELRKLHPDADEIETDPAFRAWFDEQPNRIKELITSSDVREIARGLEIYKKDMGITNKTAQDKQKEASRGVNLGSGKHAPEKGKKIWKESEIKRLSPNVLAKYMPEIDKAQAEGRIEYDLTQY